MLMISFFHEKKVNIGVGVGRSKCVIQFNVGFLGIIHFRNIKGDSVLAVYVIAEVFNPAIVSITKLSEIILFKKILTRPILAFPQFTVTTTFVIKDKIVFGVHNDFVTVKI